MVTAREPKTSTQATGLLLSSSPKSVKTFRKPLRIVRELQGPFSRSVEIVPPVMVSARERSVQVARCANTASLCPPCPQGTLQVCGRCVRAHTPLPHWAWVPPPHHSELLPVCSTRTCTARRLQPRVSQRGTDKALAKVVTSHHPFARHGKGENALWWCWGPVSPSGSTGPWCSHSPP